MMASELVVAAQADPLTVPLSVAPLCGEVQDTVGAACAASGIAPQSASAARAIGDLRNSMTTPFNRSYSLACRKPCRSLAWYLLPVGSFTNTGERSRTLRLVLKLLQL